MTEVPERQELTVGPSDLNEYLSFSMNKRQESFEINEFNLDLIRKGDEKLALEYGGADSIEKLVEHEKDQLQKFKEAQEQLNNNNRENALALLREDIQELKRAIVLNLRSGFSGIVEFGRDQNTRLVGLQMLEADLTGVEPEYYGVKIV